MNVKTATHNGLPISSEEDIAPYIIVTINMIVRYTESTDNVTLVHTDPDFITYLTSLRRLYIPYTYISAITQHGT